MKLFLVLPISLCFLFTTKLLTSRTEYVSSVCESFKAGKIDSLKAFKALDLNIDDYSIGLSNTARVFCT